MRKNFGAKPYLYPMPVLIIAAYDEKENVNAMNAAWGTICDVNQIALFLSAEHKTVKNILATQAFTVSMATMPQMAAADYVGIVSGNDVENKMTQTGWHFVKSTFVNAPLIEEMPVTLECTMVSYDTESECMIGEIVNVSIDEMILTEGDKVDTAKFQPIVYDPIHQIYRSLGEKVGDAFQDGMQLK